jgi:TolA-binding protein
MRFHLFGLILLASAAAPALAQTNSQLERRIQRLEQDAEAAQRRAGGIVEPEIRPQTGAEAGAVPTTSAVADLTARVDALEGQLARLTGATEENGHRLRQIEDALNQYRSRTDARILEMERAAAPAPPKAEPAAAAEPEAPARQENAAAADPAPSGDAGEDAYLAGFRQWEGGELAAAQRSLEAMAKKYPKHRRASYAMNLAGRAYLDDGKPATAAKLLLSNYQTNPKGDRAADSLYFLGAALVALKKPAEACKVYDELRDVYPTMRDWVKQRLPKARTDAKCA